LDKVADAWENIAENIRKAEQSVRDLQNTQQKLVSDKAIRQYFLSIAEAYGDTLRADSLRAELAQIDAEIADNTNAIADAQNSASRELEGNSKAARDNRQTITGLVSQYQSYIGSLADSGASQEKLRIETERAKKEFIDQAKALGFAEPEILKYAAAFDDVSFAINNVPRNVTIEADVNPALTALRELEAQQRKNIDLANQLNAAQGKPTSSAPSSSGGSGTTQTPSTSPGLDAQRSSALATLRAINNNITNLNNRINGHNSDRSLYARANNLAAWQRIMNDLQAQLSQQRKAKQDVEARLRALGVGSFATGGFTGRGRKLEPAGVVHRGEYVVPKQHVDQRTGIPEASFLAAMQNGFNRFGNVSTAGSINMPDAIMVELSPYDRALLQQAGNIQLRLDGRVVAQAANRNNVVSAQRGSN
jgi:hypothetical protein